MAAKKTRKKKDTDVSIKIKNLDKAIKAGKNMDSKKCHSPCGGNFWVFGSALAMILSYAKSSSILWAIFHGILSWIYIIYRAIVDSGLF